MSAHTTGSAQSGTDWSPEENDILVADYFTMLGEELAGRDYVKAHHRRAVVQRVRRSEASVEFKHRNISAVLMKLGLPRIRGYLPAWNAQFGALSLSIERYLALDGSLLAPITLPMPPAVVVDPFVPAPALALMEDKRQEPLRRLVRKFDPVARDARNRSLGKQGEAFVVEVEERRLHAAGRPDLMRQVRWVADIDGDGAGYDVLVRPEHGRRHSNRGQDHLRRRPDAVLHHPQRGSPVAGEARRLPPLPPVRLRGSSQDLRVALSAARLGAPGNGDLDGVVRIEPSTRQRAAQND